VLSIEHRALLAVGVGVNTRAVHSRPTSHASTLEFPKSPSTHLDGSLRDLNRTLLAINYSVLNPSNCRFLDVSVVAFLRSRSLAGLVGPRFRLFGLSKPLGGLFRLSRTPRSLSVAWVFSLIRYWFLSFGEGEGEGRRRLVYLSVFANSFRASLH
jgi:hypothetical protein